MITLGLSDVAFMARATAFDPDALAYFARVEGVNGDNQALEVAVKVAINDFVVGCKADGIWGAIKASCIMAGARTLSGALQPLVGTAPTSFNFVSGDYDRKTGLVGDGSTKYLDSNRNNNADPQDSKHLSVFVTQSSTTTSAQDYIGAGGNVAGGSRINTLSTLTSFVFRNNQSNTTINTLTTSTNRPVGLYGNSRSNSADYSVRVAANAFTFTIASGTPLNQNIDLYRRTINSTYTDSRMSFYSIGESLDLAQLESRVSALMTAIDGAIP
jgi:hypothetical protein